MKKLYIAICITAALHGEIKYAPLHIAAKNGDCQEINRLLDNGGTSIDQLNWGEPAPKSYYYGETALGVAIQHGQINAMKCLIERGADVNAITGQVPRYSHEETKYPMLLKAVQFKVQCPHALIKRCSTCQESERHKEFKYLWNPPLDIYGPHDNEGHCSVCQQQERQTIKSMVQLLLKHGAQINAYGAYYETALICAAQRGDCDLAQILIDHGALINHKSQWNHTALMYAVLSDNIEMIQLLLKHGAKIDECTNWGSTALILYLRRGNCNIDVIKQLLNHGADVNVRDHYDCTALRLAINNNDIEIKELLLNHGAIAGTPTEASNNSSEPISSKELTKAIQDISALTLIAGIFGLYVSKA